jgi:hypothetical protein
VLPMLLLVAAAACGGEGFSDREVEAARLVEAQAGEAVTCRDPLAALNVELPPDPVFYSCFNEAGEFYEAAVSSDGGLTSLSGPVRLTPAEQ